MMCEEGEDQDEFIFDRQPTRLNGKILQIWLIDGVFQLAADCVGLINGVRECQRI